MSPTNPRPEWFDHGITTPAVDEYLYSLLPLRDEVLAEMEAEAIQRKIPIVGPAVARILYQLAIIDPGQEGLRTGIGNRLFDDLVGPRRRAKAGRVIYTDSDRKNADHARRYFDRAGVAKQITIEVGDALELLSEEKREYRHHIQRCR